MSSFNLGSAVMFFKYCFLLFILVSAVKSAHIKKNKNVGIIGGHDISISKVPYMVSIQTPDGSDDDGDYSHGCGGTIIHERFILTAAHCLHFADKFKVLVGSDNNRNGTEGELYEVEKAISHKKFNMSILDYDVGLLKLKKPLKFGPKVQTVSLMGGDDVKGGDYVQATGWGRTSAKHFHGTHKLQQVSVPVIDMALCLKMHKKFSNETGIKLTSRMICAGAIERGGCHGDSGGPLTWQNTHQIGITSWGKSCSIFPVIYTKVSEVLPWILSKINDNL